VRGRRWALPHDQVHGCELDAEHREDGETRNALEAPERRRPDREPAVGVGVEVRAQCARRLSPGLSGNSLNERAPESWRTKTRERDVGYGRGEKRGSRVRALRVVHRPSRQPRLQLADGVLGAVLDLHGLRTALPVRGLETGALRRELARDLLGIGLQTLHQGNLSELCSK
jgi:hypothetical protein